jgi:hypothetical protein
LPASLDRGKDFRDLCIQLRELERKNGFSGMQNDVQGSGELRQMAPHCRAHPSANAIALNRPSQNLANRKTHARAVRTSAFAVEGDYISREMLLALLIDGLEICVFEQP